MAFAVSAMMGYVDAGFAFALAHALSGFVAVHVRHLDIHQNDVERIRGSRLRQPPGRLPTTATSALAVEQPGRQFLVHDIVLSKQDSQRTAALGGSMNSRGDGSRLARTAEWLATDWRP